MVRPRIDSCLVTLVRTQTLVTTHFARRLRRHGLSPAAYTALVLLQRHRAPLSPHQLGEAMMVTRGAVTGLLDSLERRGLVVRRRHPQDRRMLLVELTPTGERLLDELGREHDRGERELLGCLRADERETLSRLLTRLQAHLRDLPGGPAS